MRADTRSFKVGEVLDRKTCERPPWLIQRIPAGKNAEMVRSLVGELGLHTVCQSAACPNTGECFASATATFLILGGICTRQCQFCAVTKGEPLPLDCTEPDKLSLAVKALGLKHVVITSVTRDDLADGGSGQFVACVNKVRQFNPGVTVEVLVPDFSGDCTNLASVLQARPEVFNHNIETVPRLYQQVRPKADYECSLGILAAAAQARIGIVKSGIMLGLGENEEEVLAVFSDLRTAGVISLTIGQYLRPSSKHLPVVQYVSPDKFRWYEHCAYEAGFKKVAAGPLVRSSYHAADFL